MVAVIAVGSMRRKGRRRREAKFIKYLYALTNHRCLKKTNQRWVDEKKEKKKRKGSMIVCWIEMTKRKEKKKKGW